MTEYIEKLACGSSQLIGRMQEYFIKEKKMSKEQFEKILHATLGDL